jgi:hypothetical protein
VKGRASAAVGRDRLGREQPVEEGAVTRQGDAQILRRGLVAFVPMTLEFLPPPDEAGGQLLDEIS